MGKKYYFLIIVLLFTSLLLNSSIRLRIYYAGKTFYYLGEEKYYKYLTRDNTHFSYNPYSRCDIHYRNFEFMKSNHKISFVIHIVCNDYYNTFFNLLINEKYILKHQISNLLNKYSIDEINTDWKNQIFQIKVTNEILKFLNDNPIISISSQDLQVNYSEFQITVQNK